MPVELSPVSVFMAKVAQSLTPVAVYSNTFVFNKGDGGVPISHISLKVTFCCLRELHPLLKLQLVLSPHLAYMYSSFSSLSNVLSYVTSYFVLSCWDSNLFSQSTAVTCGLWIGFALCNSWGISVTEDDNSWVFTRIMIKMVHSLPGETVTCGFLGISQDFYFYIFIEFYLISAMKLQNVYKIEWYTAPMGHFFHGLCLWGPTQGYLVVF